MQCSQAIEIWALHSPAVLDESLQDIAESLLGADELALMLRFATEERRAAFAYRRVARRLIAASRLGREPGDILFQANPRGAPAIEGADMRFSSSSSGRRVLIGLAPCFLFGLDVQQALDALDAPSLIHRIADVEEIDQASRFWGSDLRRIFFRLWAAKEAAVKALGLGLSLDLRRVSVSPTSAGAAIAVGSPRRNATLSAVFVSLWHGAEVCIAFDACAPEIRIHRTLPDGVRLGAEGLSEAGSGRD